MASSVSLANTFRINCDAWVDGDINIQSLNAENILLSCTVICHWRDRHSSHSTVNCWSCSILPWHIVESFSRCKLPPITIQTRGFNLSLLLSTKNNKPIVTVRQADGTSFPVPSCLPPALGPCPWQFEGVRGTVFAGLGKEQKIGRWWSGK